MQIHSSSRSIRPRWLLPSMMAGSAMALSVPTLLPAQSRTAAPPMVTAPVPLSGPAVPLAASPPGSAPPVIDTTQLGQVFTDVAQRLLPSVVSIRVEAEADNEEMMGGAEGAPFMIPFGGGMGGQGDGRPPPMMHGEGSGVILRADGVILTNNHVVQRARRLTVRLHDGRTFRGHVLGTDPATDLALVRIDAQGLPTAPLGDSDHARVGEWVLAIGAPLGLEYTVTHGVVSATGRGGLGANEIEDYLQTDASINPGNSGGPLVNLRGEVLGINTMIVGRNTGIGMAIPSRLAQSVVDQLMRTGHVARGWIGVGLQDVTSELASTMGLGAVRGALVNQIEANTPAAHAGLQPGDVITAIDGSPITQSADLMRTVTRRGVGERMTFSAVRAGRPMTFAIVTVQRPGNERVAANGQGVDPNAQDPAAQQGLGLRLATLSPELAMRMGAPSDGVVVAGVLPGSAADEAGLRRGDLILRADGQAVHSIRDVMTATQDRHATLLVRRGRAQLFVPVTMD